MRFPILPVCLSIVWTACTGANAQEPLPLQAMVDAADTDAVLVLEPGVYKGPLTIEKPITLDGQGAVTIDGQGKGSVLYIHSDGTTIKNLHLTNSGESHNDIDSCIQVRGNFNVFKDNQFDNCLFGMDVQLSEYNIIRRNRLASSKPFRLGQRGDAIRLWYSSNNKITDNYITNSRDMVLWYSSNNVIARNTVTQSRYSLHFMYAHSNLVEDNEYINNATGIFLMYSDHAIIRNNHVAHATGAGGIGIGIKESSSIEVKGNKILYCASGLYLDLSPFEPETTILFDDNLIAYNSIGVRFLNDWKNNVFHNNYFAGNMTQITVAGGGGATRNEWKGNYWSDYEGFDRDQDGIGDKPYVLYGYADQIWTDVPFAQFFKGSPLLEVLDFLERLAPFSEPKLLLQDLQPVLANKHES